MPTITMPPGPKLGEKGKRIPEAEFRTTWFDHAIEAKGYLLAWTRATLCPCAPVTEDNDTPDPNCPVCKGTGWRYFGAQVPQDLDRYQLDEVQKAIIANTNAIVIRGVLSGISTQYNPWDKLGRWLTGLMQLTVRAENKLAFYDRLTTLDGEIAFAEVLVTTTAMTLPTRYLATGVNYLHTLTQEFKPGVDYAIVRGVITWLPGKNPGAGVRVGAHYLCHPTWLVVEHPHAFRMTTKTLRVRHPKTPAGDAKLLPIQAMVRLDFIPDPN